MQQQDDIFLAKWLNNELSAAELEAFKASEHYDMYVKIAEGSKQFQAPEYNLDSSFSQLKHKRANRSPQVKTFKWLRYVASVAAIFIIGLVGYNFFFAPTNYETGYGEQLAINLPDGSKVILNAKSTLSFHKSNWDTNRNLTLDGEAFFDVAKGKTFTVNTHLGNVSVLGTEFNVKSDNDLFEVICYEGKVQVEDITNNQNTILTPHNGYRHIENHEALTLTDDANTATWTKNETSFKSLPIKYVFAALERQFEIKIIYNHFNSAVLYTGSFPNNNQAIALETVLKSVNLNYSIQGNRVIIEE
ncbi:FecR family protein [Pseudofulvibacter geojedonensis]|uniref:FecR family protein n=1 Tax=Pseudofulvibacter geojedonensis TaxID=1123758 RepID=A0ABW3I3H0_9FLAO